MCGAGGMLLAFAQEDFLVLNVLNIFQAIAGEVADLDTPVHDLLAQAQSLLENNKDTAKRDPGTQQQYQRLRFNTSDLKVRFNNVSFVTIFLI